MTWNPDPLEPLYEGDELGSINTLITFTPPLGVIDEYEVTIVGPPQDVFTAQAGILGITVTTLNSDLTGVYPIERLTYLDDDLNSVDVTLWGDIPFGSTMTAMIPDPRREVEWTIECACYFTDEFLIPQVEEESYTVIIQQSYDANQSTLRQKIAEQL